MEAAKGPVLSVAGAVLVTLCICTTGCSTNNAPNNTSAVTTVSPPAASPSPPPQVLSAIPRPQKIADAMTQRGEQDQAKPILRIVSPAKAADIKGSTVSVKLDLSGDLKGYHPMKDPSTGKGNHIHVILDNQPYEAYYDLAQPFELRNVTSGKHTLRVFPSRPWHESYKNDGAFQMVSFTVSGGGDASKPTTTNSGQVMANNNSKTSTPVSTEGKDMPASSALDVDGQKPLLTYSRPKGEYKADEADPIMIDFWLSNAKLKGGGGDFRVRYSVDGADDQYIDKWEPIWLTGWANGIHQVKLELLDKDGKVVLNGDYNSTTREITVSR